MSITIAKKTIMNFKGSVAQVNVQFDYRGYQISLGLDDSCGNKEKLFRGDFLVFKDGQEVTTDFFPDYTSASVIPASSELLKDIFLMIDAKLDTLKATITLEVPAGDAAALARKVVKLGVDAASEQLFNVDNTRNESITYDPFAVTDAELAELQALVAVKIV